MDQQLHFASKKGFLPHRGKFLDGTWQTYFGPGHQPNIIWRIEDDIPGLGSSHSPYYHPTHWPASGSLLRAPQVVWLQARVRGGDHSGEFSPADAPAQAEQARLAGVFSSVKSTIEGYRAGKTWVEVVNWYDGGAVEAAAENGLYPNFPVGGLTSYPSGAGFVNIPAATDPFFGTDYLSVWCGDHYLNEQTPVFPSSGLDPSGGPTTYTALGNWTPWLITKARLDRNRKYFYRYACRMFDPSGYLYAPSSPTTGVIFDGVVSAVAANRHDVTHPGTTSVVNDGYLLGLIAAHYGFNPGTGADL